MTDILRLVQIDFDDMENRNPLTQETLGVFVGDEHGLTAYGKASDWFDKQPPFRLYVGYDKRVYPQFRLERVITL